MQIASIHPNGDGSMAASEQKAYDAIRQAITTGTYGNGMHQRAAGLAEDLGISRTPVREALRRLHAEGLVEFVENRGAFVAPWSRENTAEVFDLRVVLESHAASLAASRLTDTQIAQLGEMTDRMQHHASEARDIGAVTQANQEFHSLIIAAAASRRLSTMIASVVEMALVSQTFNSYSDVSFARSIAHHRELIAAFQARDGVWAAAVMTSHIRAAYHVFISSIRNVDYAQDMEGEISSAA
jgi:DNA-binding GntR family transcriptional regulator